VNRKNMDPQNLHVFGKKSYWVYWLSDVCHTPS
jgi:hypothetical protein